MGRPELCCFTIILESWDLGLSFHLLLPLPRKLLPFLGGDLVPADVGQVLFVPDKASDPRHQGTEN